MNDTGPAFGEGSVALHQLLQSGRIGPLQPVGPIPTNLRCSAIESGLRPPFVSRPDLGDADRCRAGYSAKSAADIRAYAGIDGDVTSIILPRVKPPMQGWLVTEEITPDLMAKLAVGAGYSLDTLHQMADCLGR